MPKINAIDIAAIFKKHSGRELEQPKSVISTNLQFRNVFVSKEGK